MKPLYHSPNPPFYFFRHPILAHSAKPNLVALFSPFLRFLFLTFASTLLTGLLFLEIITPPSTIKTNHIDCNHLSCIYNVQILKILLSFSHPPLLPVTASQITMFHLYIIHLIQLLPKHMIPIIPKVHICFIFTPEIPIFEHFQPLSLYKFSWVLLSRSPSLIQKNLPRSLFPFHFSFNIRFPPLTLWVQSLNSQRATHTFISRY